MALRVAVANGNWSNPATWNGSVLPSSGDIVASNGFTVTIDQNVNVDSITNAAQSLIDAIPSMTSATTPSGIVTASSQDPNNPAWRAFDGSFSFSPAWYSAVATMPQWIAYEFPSPIAIDRYYLGIRGDTYDPKDWTFEGWNGSSWVVLDTVVNRTSGGNYTSPVLSNSTNYNKYRVNITGQRGTNSVIILEVDMYPYLGTTPAVAGGTFILNSGVTVTCTNTGDGIIQGITTTNCVTANASGDVTINANVRGRDGYARCIKKTGTGNIIINGALRGLIASASGGGALEITNTGTITVNGYVYEGPANGATIYVGSTCTLNIIGDITSGSFNSNYTIDVAANNCQINITGNIVVGYQGIAGWTSTVFRVTGNSNTINLVGNIDSTLGINSGANVYKHGLYITGLNNNVIHTGQIIGSSDNVSGTSPVYITNTVYYNHIGYIKASMNYFGLYSANTSSIHLLTGPFISSPSGIFPLNVIRMHYRKTLGSYFEFRDSSTNGALPPAASAPATRLVSPDTAVDAPIPANVRDGVSYALGAFTGTLKVPLPSQVSKGIQTDNTVGTAALTPEDVWNALTVDMTTAGSIGKRLKDAATVQSTGDQLAAL